MRRILFSLGLAALLVAPVVARGETQADRVQYPLAPSTIALRRGALVFKAHWSGAGGTLFNPTQLGSIVSISGIGADQTPITLDAAKWKPRAKGKGFKYTDPTGSAGGVRSVVLSVTKKGGSLVLKAGGRKAPITPAATPGDVTLTMSIGPARWCANAGPLRRVGKRMVAASDQAPASCPCVSSATGTWQAIQTNIIGRYGCAAASCHSGPTPQGGLDLGPEVAYRNLIGVASHVNPALPRITRYDFRHSAFWLKLAKKTLPDEYGNSIAPTAMPSNEFTLTKEELEALRLWIHDGAPETGVVNGTGTLLSACLPPPDPIKIVPPAVPAAADGIQLYGPPWVIQPHQASGLNGEGEICQATYFDFSAQIPDSVKLSKDDPLCAAMWGGNRDCFYAKRTELTQTPNSHHSILHIYRGAFDYGTPQYAQGTAGIFQSIGFGPFTCRTGDRAGQTCDPGGSADQCPGSVCAGRVEHGVACVGYGPADYGFDVTGTGSNNAPSVGGSQQPYSVQLAPPGVFFLYPVKGTMIWNSHAFNTTDKPTANEQYFNLYFDKDAADRQEIFRPIFDSRYIFTQNVPAFDKREYCATFTLPKGARLSGLSSHTHKRGLLFRIWMPPNEPCTPCVGGGTGLNASCRDPNPACTPDARTPVALTTTYNDPVQYNFDTPVPLDAADVASRTLKYCSVYDNGLTDPGTVKRQSTSPPTPLGNLAPGGPCKNTDVTCLNGPRKGQLCHGHNAECDSAANAGDGICDACPLRGGVTTEDEMFILLGDWYCPGTLEKSPSVCPGR